ncbi:uncharacterized protein NDAI_0E01230 [Naumovozyma dairenensis CBS 421]|uniref:Uncharacterized protein n=1 Tax=Naumovozyma dairenensis (strain ATCC 10597 / BCRC 20456 / CBS 421 / NBRC 0211 / NRRL Y-12639) TaxID=1071378 RepID=G0WB19_NAUDC|nr:hypothetical protein NDAI_0E01230 [Naumovozyma dairenensis CBS 421]CCD24939.1 hypothetical protein NDAI_0E01230 [Naumovozyma dairenensis CBS 421]
MAFKGTLHQYDSTHVAFEFTPTDMKNVLIMIGGMTDGLATVPYVTKLPQVMEPLGYSVINIQMSSSFKGFGISSLDKDIKEIKELVKYLKSEKGGSREKIIIMGHSTGAQDVMHFLLHYPDLVDAGILQGSCSDRESFDPSVDPKILKELNQFALNMVKQGKGDELLGSQFSKHIIDTPITAYRWCSLFTRGGDDDYFSSDLDDETFKGTFGKIRKPFLVAYSGKDQFVPESVDKLALLKRWENVSDPKYWSKNTGIVEGASHFVEDHEPQLQLFQMITSFAKEFSL